MTLAVAGAVSFSGISVASADNADSTNVRVSSIDNANTENIPITELNDGRILFEEDGVRTYGLFDESTGESTLVDEQGESYVYDVPPLLLNKKRSILVQE